MKKIIIYICLLFPFVVSAEVVIHQDNFLLKDNAGSEAFYGRIYLWSSWKKAQGMQSFDISPNPIKEAYSAGLSDQSVGDASEEDLLAVFPGEDGEALADYYYDFEPLKKSIFCMDLEKCPYKEVVFNSKVSVPLKKGFNINALSLKSVGVSAIKADAPHLHKKVNKKLARALLNPVHLGHDQIANHPNDEVYVSVLNFGFAAYQCNFLNRALLVNAGRYGGAIVASDYRIFNVNLLREVPASELSQLSVIEGNPVKIFEQKIISSTDVIKSAVNYMAFYKGVDGQNHMVLYSAVVTSSKVAQLFKVFLNGQENSSTKPILLNSSKEAVLNGDNLDLSTIEGNCSRGLSGGLGRYVYGLAKKISEQ